MHHEDSQSLRDKISQMLIMGFTGDELNSSSKVSQWIEKDKIGGVILFDIDANTNSKRNIINPHQVKQLNSDLQNINKKNSSLPLIISVDYEGGFVNRLKEEYGFPKTYTPASIAKLGLDAARSASSHMAKTLKEAGFNLNFSPLLDVNINPNNPIIAKYDRSFSTDEFITAEFAKIYVQSFLEQGIQSCYKHFPGHGSSTCDSHLGFVDVSDTFEMRELVPYEILLKENICNMIMSAHVINRQLDASALPATLSKTILTDLLRNKLVYNGIIITDDMDMKAISEHYSIEEALVLAINAGADMFIFGNNILNIQREPKDIIDIIEAKISCGEVDVKCINESYNRIVKFKENIQ